MRNVEKIWNTWRSGLFVGETKPSTRVTVEKNWRLQSTGPVVGQWNRGPARWYQTQANDQVETEIPNVLSVNISRDVASDAGTCEISLRNVLPPEYGQPEWPPGQYGDIGYYTFDHGASQDAKARWGHVLNPWHEVLVPNALLRTYQGFGGQDKTVETAVADGDIVLNGVWLVDDITIGTDGAINVRCRDMGKLLVDQQLFPELVPLSLYPLDYRRWIYKVVTIPKEEPDPSGCWNSSYGFGDAAWHSSTDEYYGAFNATNTGHPAGEAFDISYETGPIFPGSLAHQRSYWLSEPQGGPNDWVWVEFTIEGGASRVVNSIYFHPWAGNYYVQVSIFENGEWVAPQTPDGGTTAHGIPFVGTIVTNYEGGQPWGVDTNKRSLPRDYNASRVRLTISNLVRAPEGGWRAGARKIMACYDAPNTTYRNYVFASAAIPVNEGLPPVLGYWQVRGNGTVYAFGDARVLPFNSPNTQPANVVVGMAAHPNPGAGYWLVDIAGRVLSAGQATHYGDLDGVGRTDIIDIAATPSGEGYWLLAKNGEVFTFGDAVYHGGSSHIATMPSGAPALARSIESHPVTQGYWVVWSDGWVTNHNLTHHGHALDRTGMTTGEYITAIRRTSTGNGYWIVSGGGRVQVGGDAQFLGNVSASITYDSSQWPLALVWDLIPSSSSDAGYAIQHADGKLEPRGDFRLFGSIGGGSATQRYDGNYKDYADIIRDLLLWGGFYLYKDPQPEAEKPEVYGNVEYTGAWAEDPLPKEMFDKRPIAEAIREIREIVGYVFFIDAEGGARFESPNWWTMGNFLIDGTPFAYMPEVDEAVQLTSHSVTRSASSARSTLIIATQDPMPTEPGKEIAAGITKTQITPRTAPDLRGLLVPAMWTNGKFLRADEQAVMADLIDLRMWMARRTGQITCVANPLIDVNDQVRIVERQTGEVYIHYVRSVQFSHDLQTGSFTMNLSTHWLGGSPYGVNARFLAGESRPQGDGYWTATFGGYSAAGESMPGIYAFGDAPLFDRHQADSHLDLIIAFRSTPSGLGYYSMDRSGKILTYGDAVHRGEVRLSVPDAIDLALSPSGAGYWVIQRNGTINAFGDAVHLGQPTVSGLMPNGQPVRAEAIESHPITMGYWVLLSDGTVHAYNLSHHGNANRDGFTANEYCTSLRRSTSGAGYWVLSGGARVQAFGDAPDRGDGQQYADNDWVNGLTWTLLTNPANGYATLHSDGNLDTMNYTDFGPAAANRPALVWALVSPEAHEELGSPSYAYALPVNVMQFLKNTASPSANNAAASGFGTPPEPTFKALTS